MFSKVLKELSVHNEILYHYMTITCTVNLAEQNIDLHACDDIQQRTYINMLAAQCKDTADKQLYMQQRWQEKDFIPESFPKDLRQYCGKATILLAKQYKVCTIQCLVCINNIRYLQTITTILWYFVLCYKNGQIRPQVSFTQWQSFIKYIISDAKKQYSVQDHIWPHKLQHCSIVQIVAQLKQLSWR